MRRFSNMEVMDARVKHGHGRRSGITPEYMTWKAMRTRCNAVDGPDFLTYAAKGISVCERWNSFTLFFVDMGPRPSAKHSLGRKNNHLGYYKENCRWETNKQQQTNTSASMIWTIRGLTFDSCRAAAAHFKVDQSTVRYWVKTRKSECHASKRY